MIIQEQQESQISSGKKVRIDFGCGQNCTKDQDGKYIGVDQVQLEGVDIVHDLTQFPYPFEDNSVDEIVSNHFVEHLGDSLRGTIKKYLKKSKSFKEFQTDLIAHLDNPNLPDSDFIAHMDECYRILKLGGQMRVVHPYAFSVRAFQDPTHKTFIPSERYAYFDKNQRAAMGISHYAIKSDFEYRVYVSPHTDKGENWELRSEEFRNFAMSHYLNVTADLIVYLTKR